MRLFFRFWPYPILAAGLVWAIAVNQSTGRWGAERDSRGPNSPLSERFYVSYLIAVALVHAVGVFVIFRNNQSTTLPLKVSLVALVLPWLELLVFGVLAFMRIEVRPPLMLVATSSLKAIEAVQFRNLTSAALCARDDQHSFNSGLFVRPTFALPLDGGRFFTAFEIADRRGNVALRTVLVDPVRGSMEGGSAQPIQAEGEYDYYALPEGTLLVQGRYGNPGRDPLAMIVGKGGERQTIRFPLAGGHRDANHDAILPVLTDRPVLVKRWLDLGKDARFDPALHLYEADAAAASVDARVSSWSWPRADEPINRAYGLGADLVLVLWKEILRLDQAQRPSTAFREATSEALARHRIEIIDKAFLDNGTFYVAGTAPDPAGPPGTFRAVLIKLDSEGREVKGFAPLDSVLLQRDFGLGEFLAHGRLDALFVRGENLFLTSEVPPFILKFGRDGQVDKSWLTTLREALRPVGRGAILGVSNEGAILYGQSGWVSINEKRSGRLLLIRPDGTLDPSVNLEF